MRSEENGGGTDRPDGVHRVTIAWNPFTHHADLDLGGLALDDALSVLERAHRELEARFRFNRARELQAEAMQQMAADQLVRNAMRDPRIKV